MLNWPFRQITTCIFPYSTKSPTKNHPILLPFPHSRALWWGKQERESISHQEHLKMGKEEVNSRGDKKGLPKDENYIPLQDTDDNRIHSLEWPRQAAHPRNTSRDKQWQPGTCASFGGHVAPILHSQQEWPWHSSYPGTHFNLLTILRQQSIKPAVLL